MAFEAAAAPITAFLIAPLAEFWILPWARSSEGSAALEPLLGAGVARGIALVFLVGGVVMIIAAALAMLTKSYRQISASYDAAAPPDDVPPAASSAVDVAPAEGAGSDASGRPERDQSPSRSSSDGGRAPGPR